MVFTVLTLIVFVNTENKYAKFICAKLLPFVSRMAIIHSIAALLLRRSEKCRHRSSAAKCRRFSTGRVSEWFLGYWLSQRPANPIRSTFSKAMLRQWPTFWMAWVSAAPTETKG
jgi:hypothetical protein